MKKKKNPPKERSYFYEMNKIFLGDCLEVLREKLEIPDESVDLIYIDPPFNSKRNYSIFFDQDDSEIRAQHIAFTDTWSLKNVAEQLVELDTLQTEELKKLLDVYQEVAKHAFPYLLMMSIRIVELHRVLHETGSFYLHCDSTMSHYLKTICDVIFGHKHFRNEIIWQRTTNSGSSKARARKFSADTDSILYYTKSDVYTFNKEKIEYKPEYLARFIHDDNDGKGKYRWQPLKTYSKETYDRLKEEGELLERPTAKYPDFKQYVDKLKGGTRNNLWLDLTLNPMADEKLGYPTQKPLPLLKRIISTSSNEGDVVLDAFCGCGTTVDAAEELKRKWIGIDISPVSISLIQKRLRDTYKGNLSKLTVRGMPVNLESAELLARENPNAFQDWWVLQFSALSPTFGKSGADFGIDGIAKYRSGKKGETINVGFQVKATRNVGRPAMDNLLGVMEKHKYPIGIFLTLVEPSKDALEMVGEQGFVDILGVKYPKIQVLTLKEFYENKRPKLPPNNITFSSAKFKPIIEEQQELDM